jgi:NAD(P)-dependent dehydrogenase (short-subunit alcohol dehydrogenase family)
VLPLLEGKIVFVSGGSQGLGAAIARAAVREGAEAVVVVTGRRREAGEKFVAELAEQGAATDPATPHPPRASRGTADSRRITARFVQADVGDVAQAQAAVQTALAEFGRVDCLVNSAGLTSRGTLLDTTPELFDAHVAVNLRGPYFTMQAVVRDMVRRKAPGTVVNIISIAELGGQPYLSPYVAAKAGLAGATRNAAHAHRWDRIRINGLDIGWTDSEGEDATQREFHGAGDNWRAKAAASVPMGKLGQVDEIADFVVFLLSDRSGVVTGSIIDWDQAVVGGSD